MSDTDGIDNSQWQEFDQKYGVLERSDAAGEYLYETYGDDLALVQEFDPYRVWTLVEEDGIESIMAGYHFINRINYLLTARPWQSEDEVYLP